MRGAITTIEFKFKGAELVNTCNYMSKIKIYIKNIATEL